MVGYIILSGNLKNKTDNWFNLDKSNYHPTKVIWRLPEPSDSKIWSWVPWDSEPRITVLARASSNLAFSQPVIFKLCRFNAACMSLQPSHIEKKKYWILTWSDHKYIYYYPEAIEWPDTYIFSYTLTIDLIPYKTYMLDSFFLHIRVQNNASLWQT
jgi:hypothetical protein